LANALLAFNAYGIEQNVPRIAQQLVIVHGALFIGSSIAVKTQLSLGASLRSVWVLLANTGRPFKRLTA